jgi:hypothetical protein
MRAILRASGIFIGLTGLGLAFIWFGWKLAAILLLVIWGNNLERQSETPIK